MSIRLINTKTLRMKAFPSQNAPKYAILSHTWVDDEEVSYQEMGRLVSDPDHPAMKKSGYRKILNVCQKATAHNLEYAWVDTCCIDKTSSAELIEAINSMFKWYQMAEVCYVFLSDLPPRGKGHVKESMGACRWYTRGWCLQELIAPENLRLYNEAWEFVGSKKDLGKLISSITNIDEEVLRNSRKLATVPLARRMSWAATRVTSREEDMAYCLLGIFDVNMPMLYGEGSKAFLRLQEEIIRTSNDLSIFANFGQSPQSHEYSSPSKEHSMSFPVWHKSAEATFDLPSGKDLSQYKDLFAHSPKQFVGCGLLTRPATQILSGRPFTMTNNGLYFRTVDLLVEEQMGIYILPLGCSRYGPDDQECQMWLRKVGAGLFVRLESCHTNYPSDDDVYVQTEEVYIITQLNPAIRPVLDRFRHQSITIESDGTPSLCDALQSINPRDRWDAPNLRFLTYGETSFEGHMKVIPHLTSQEAGGDRFGRSYGHFYLAFGFEKERGRKLDMWVTLFTSEEWEQRRKEYGNTVGLRFGGLNGLQSKLKIDETEVRVKIRPGYITKSELVVELAWLKDTYHEEEP